MPDPTRRQIKLLCHFDNNTTDVSDSARTAIQTGEIAYTNNATYAQFGYSMRILRKTSEDGRLAYDISDVDLSGEFCIDYWFNSIHASYWGQYVWQLSNGTLQHKCGDVASAGFYTNGVFTKVSQTRKVKHHGAVSRDNTGTLRWFYDGVKQTELQSDVDFTSEQIWLSWTYSNGTGALTWMDEVRVVSGCACYTADFTPPSDPYTIPEPTSTIWTRQTQLII